MTVVDATLGAAGHGRALLEGVSPGGFLLGLDRDPQMAEIATATLGDGGFCQGTDFEVVVARFATLPGILTARGIKEVHRIFADLGVNSLHLDRAERGFSMKRDGPLDMRMNPEEPGRPSAADIVNSADEAALATIFEKYGEERFARRIAKHLVAARAADPLTTTAALRDVVAGAIPRALWPPKTDPATRVFQALRIEVNGELDDLRDLLDAAPGLLSAGGRFGVLTFHSLEDRMVKRAFADLCRSCVCPPEIPQCRCGGVAAFSAVAKAATATAEEVEANPRSRSAKLRVIEKN